MTLKTKNFILLGGAIILVVTTVVVYWRQYRGDDQLQPQVQANQSQVDSSKAELDRITQEELINGCLEKDDKGQDIFCGESKARVDAAMSKYQQAVIDADKPSEQAIVDAKSAIREFMDSSDLQLEYINTSKHPSNFLVGKTTVIDSGAYRIDTPSEWERPVYVIQQKEYINDRCEVYEYEVSTDTNEVIEVHVVYPEEIQRLKSSGEKLTECGDLGSLEIPVKPKSEIEEAAKRYLKRGISNFDEIESQLVYTPSTKDATNAPAANEWSWQNDDYAWPEGWSGDNPKARIIMTSGGKLISYYNNLSLFYE